MPNLGKAGTVALMGNMASGGTQIALRVMDVAAADADRGKMFTANADRGDGFLDFTSSAVTTSNLRINGVYQSFAGAISTTAGQSINLTITEADLTRVARGEGDRIIVLLVKNGASAWQIASSWTVTVRTTAPKFWVRLQRSLDGTTLALIRTLDDASISASASYGATVDTQAWTGLRSARDGMKGYYFSLPVAVSSVTLTMTDAFGNTSSQTLVTPPVPIALTTGITSPTWNLPTWLPLTGQTLDYYNSLESALPDYASAAAQLNALTSAAQYLDRHAELSNAPVRFANETDADFVLRIMAALRGRFNGRVPLEAHLSDVAGCKVVIRDATSAVVLDAIQLDGTRQIDGSFQLGGAGGTYAAGTYLVSFLEPLDSDLERVLAEFERLRPVGLFPTLEHRRETNIGIWAGISGVTTRSP